MKYSLLASVIAATLVACSGEVKFGIDELDKVTAVCDINGGVLEIIVTDEMHIESLSVVCIDQAIHPSVLRRGKGMITKSNSEWNYAKRYEYLDKGK